MKRPQTGLALVLGVGCVALGLELLSAGWTAEGLLLLVGAVLAWVGLLAPHFRRPPPS